MAPHRSSSALSSSEISDEAGGAERSQGHNQDEPIQDGKAICRPWKIFPVSQRAQLEKLHGRQMVKLVHVVRHAEGTHNVQKDYKSEANLDARLTEKGKQQCSDLAKRTDDILVSRDGGENSICVLTSPMTRCIQTAMLSFPGLWSDPRVPFIAQENWRETVNYNCDRRRPLSEIRAEFPEVDWNEYPKHSDEDDAIWSSYRERLGDTWETHMESAELYKVAERGYEGLQKLQARPESEIIICTHSAFLRCMLSWGQEGGVPLLMPQALDDRDNKKAYPLLEYSCIGSDQKDNGKYPDKGEFEVYMRQDYKNCELRSFCLLVTEEVGSE